MNKYSEAMENIKVTDEMRSRILRNVALSLEKGSDNEEGDKPAEEPKEAASVENSSNVTGFKPVRRISKAAWIASVGLTAAAALVLVIVRPWSGSSLMSGGSQKAATDYEAVMSEEASMENNYDTVAEVTEAAEEYDDYPVYDDEPAAEAGAWAEEETKDNSEGIEGMVFDAAEFPSVREMSDAIGFEVNDISVVPFEATEVIYRVISGKLAEIVYIGDGDKLTIRKSAGEEDNSGDYNEYTLDEPIEIEGNKIDILGFEEGYYLVTWYDGEYFHSIRSDSPQTADKMKEIISDLIKGE